MLEEHYHGDEIHIKEVLQIAGLQPGGGMEKMLALFGVGSRGMAFTCKVFPDVGHGGLAGEQIPRFADEVRAAHVETIAKMA